MNSNETILPNLVIIGAQKCATTSLHYYLGLHPEVSMSREKELDFFIREYNWDKGVQWYKSQFSGNTRIHGETSPNYSAYPFFDGVPERMQSVIPETKLIYSLRDPIDRIFAHYVHRYALGLENRSIGDALKDFDDCNLYVERSRYFMQLERYLAYFHSSSILIITAEDLYNNRRQTMKEIFRFLNVDEGYWSAKFHSLWHRSKYKRRKTETGMRLEKTAFTKFINFLPYELRGAAEKFSYIPFSSKIRKPVLDESLRRKIIDFLKDDIERLREFTRNDLDGWCV